MLTSFLKKLGKVLLFLTLGFILLIGLLIGYFSYREKEASRQAKDFCDQIVIGSTAVGLREAALAQGADEHSKWIAGEDDMYDLPVMFIGLPPFSRHICWVKAKDGRIISAKLSYID